MCVVVGGLIGAAVITAGTGAYEASQQQGISSQALSLAQDTQGKQDQYNQQLQQLLANPNAFFKSAPYQAAFGQGLQAVQRGQAASGNPAGPGQAAALQQFGQGFGAQQLMGQEQLLASLSGAQTASSPAQGLQVAAGAQASSAAQLSGALGSLGFLYAASQNANSPTSGLQYQTPTASMWDYVGNPNTGAAGPATTYPYP